MYQLQIFDHESGKYVKKQKCDDVDILRQIGRGLARSFRIVSLHRHEDPDIRRNYGKPLPLKPRSPYRRARRYKLGTVAEPASPRTLADRAIAWYQARAERGERHIPVYVWASGQWEFTDRLTQELRCIQASIGAPCFSFVHLDDDGEIIRDRAAA